MYTESKYYQVEILDEFKHKDGPIVISIGEWRRRAFMTMIEKLYNENYDLTSGEKWIIEDIYNACIGDVYDY